MNPKNDDIFADDYYKIISKKQIRRFIRSTFCKVCISYLIFCLALYFFVIAVCPTGYILNPLYDAIFEIFTASMVMFSVYYSIMYEMGIPYLLFLLTVGFIIFLAACFCDPKFAAIFAFFVPIP